MSKFSRKKSIFSVVGLFLLIGSAGMLYSFTASDNNRVNATNKVVSTPVVAAISNHLYDSLHFDQAGLSRNAFECAVTGFSRLLNEGRLHNDSILTIVDFSLSSGRKRLFVINTKSGNILFNTYVSHGRNSGGANATSFSNDPDSYKSSLGFYITGNTYKGQHGYSLKLMGEEDGINDNAFDRGIVMHSAYYVNEKLAMSQGFIGRSQGCPAVPIALYKPIIRVIKEGSCLFLYSPDKSYASNSKLIQPLG